MAATVALGVSYPSNCRAGVQYGRGGRAGQASLACQTYGSGLRVCCPKKKHCRWQVQWCTHGRWHVCCTHHVDFHAGDNVLVHVEHLSNLVLPPVA